MAKINNYERLIELAEQVFAFRTDPDQLNVNPKVRSRLLKVHPCTLSETRDENGPVAWLLVIPTTEALMNRFLSTQISEKELYDLTPLNQPYDSIYLCSALVLEEYRRKGIIRQMALKAIGEICKDHPIKSLFVWAFTKEGDMAAENISKLTSLPLYRRIG